MSIKGILLKGKIIVVNAVEIVYVVVLVLIVIVDVVIIGDEVSMQVSSIVDSVKIMMRFRSGQCHKNVSSEG